MAETDHIATTPARVVVPEDLTKFSRQTTFIPIAAGIKTCDKSNLKQYINSLEQSFAQANIYTPFWPVRKSSDQTKINQGRATDTMPLLMQKDEHGELRFNLFEFTPPTFLPFPGRCFVVIPLGRRTSIQGNLVDVGSHHFAQDMCTIDRVHGGANEASDERFICLVGVWEKKPV